MKLIDKDTLVAEIERLKDMAAMSQTTYAEGCYEILKTILSIIDALDVIDPYEQCVQYDSIEAGIQAYAETYSFNIESELFYQLTKEQQPLWRKEIEQACVNGGNVGVELARDPRYKENFEAKEVEEGSLEKFKSLQHISRDLKSTLQDWGYAPNLYFCDGMWHVSWISCEKGDSIKDFEGNTPEKAIDKACNWFHSTFCNS